MGLSDWFLPSRRLMAMFAGLILVPAVALGWLAWRTLDQDRQSERYRTQERLQRSADLLAATLRERLRALPGQVPAMFADAGPLPEDSLLVSFRASVVETRPPGRLLYLPDAPASPSLPPGIFAAAEDLEFRKEDYAGAARIYRDASNSPDTGVRAAALVALARNLRKAGRPDDAGAAYERLAQLNGEVVDGVPAVVIARHERCKLLAGRHSPSLVAEAASLYADLQQARWPLDRGAWEYFSEEARRWLDSKAEEPPAPQLALADAAGEIAHIGQSDAHDSGLRAVMLRSRPLLLVWNREHDRTTALAAGPEWLAGWLDFGTNLGLDVALYNASGARVVGRAFAPDEPQAALSASDSGLPWTLRVAVNSPAADLGSFETRRRLLLAAFGLAGILLLSGGYVVARSLARELAVARLQSDFVSAVSHEFRSPLASICHLTGLLREGAVASESRRGQYYDVLARERDRLRRLVEGLLDFGKMQAGKAQYNFAPVELGSFIEQVASEFRNGLSQPDRLSVEKNGEPLLVDADREALARALYNLLDNAAKYSPPGSPIRVTASADGGERRIEVSDSGPGIPESEQKEIFRAFYRGAATKELGVQGTGIGLAMVRRIVDAHGGRIALASSPVAGSRFAIVLPASHEGEGKD